MSEDKDYRLQKTFDYVRRTFFPRWDKGREWQVQVDPNLPSLGKCDLERRRIVLQKLPEDPEDFDRLLIHEIAHAVGCLGHSKKWQTRFLKAAERAKAVGRKELANAIRDEVKSYQEQKTVSAKEIYAQIGGYVLDTKGEEPYESLVKVVAREYGMYVHELEKHYKKCRDAYDKAVNEYQASLALRKRFWEEEGN